ncbi:rhodanese-like domain-containing protein [Phaeovulum sp.]|uniref:rhodanese-like domain-containing protein n=1 Tax=Phaeovulum sp. TaxID=2934796 RepID=UPI0035661E97
MSSITKRQFLALGVGAVAIAGAGYAWSQSTATSNAPAFEERSMTVAEMMASGALVVDIRRPDEWVETGVIDGATLLTFESPNSFLEKIGPQIADGRDVVLICRSGNRSRLAAEALAPMIPNHVVSVVGGMSQQIAEGYQTSRPVCPAC